MTIPTLPSPKTQPWGHHLILDCKACDIKKIRNKEEITAFSKRLVDDIDMVAYGKPFAEHFGKNNIKTAGYTLLQPIETSSITGHFVDDSGDAYLDVFSCMKFDPEKVVTLVKEFFHPKSITETLLDRHWSLIKTPPTPHSKAQTWGYHLILDCNACNIEKISNKESIIDFSKQLVDDIDMVAYGKPFAEHFGKNNVKTAGYTLLQPIETSSITGHFVDDSGDAYLDVFSCMEFDPKKVVTLVKEFFQPQSITELFLHRQA